MSSIDMPLRRELFWDADLTQIDLEQHAPYIISRILLHGRPEDFGWAREKYGEERVKEVFLEKHGSMDKRSTNFWCHYFKLEEQCIQKQSNNKRAIFWRK